MLCACFLDIAMVMMEKGASSAPPGAGREENDHGHDLQTAKQHGEGKNELRGEWIAAKVARRANCAQAGAHVVYTGQRRGQVAFQPKAAKRDQQAND